MTYLLLICCVVNILLCTKFSQDCEIFYCASVLNQNFLHFHPLPVLNHDCEQQRDVFSKILWKDMMSYWTKNYLHKFTALLQYITIYLNSSKIQTFFDQDGQVPEST